MGAVLGVDKPMLMDELLASLKLQTLLDGTRKEIGAESKVGEEDLAGGKPKSGKSGVGLGLNEFDCKAQADRLFPNFPGAPSCAESYRNDSLRGKSTMDVKKVDPSPVMLKNPLLTGAGVGVSFTDPRQVVLLKLNRHLKNRMFFFQTVIEYATLI